MTTPERGDRAQLRPWLVVGLAAWAALGVMLIDRESRLGNVSDVLISPYHAVGYAALIALGLYSATAFFPALRHGRWRHAFPPLYGGVGLSFVLFVSFFLVTLVWRGVVGEARGIELGIGPPALLVPTAMVLLALGPVREAIASRDAAASPDSRSLRWAGAAAVGLVGVGLSFQPFEPIREPTNDFTVNAGSDVSEIWSMAWNGSGQTRLLAAFGDGVDYSLPAWSPDGSRIAFTTWTNVAGVAQNVRDEDQSAAIWTMAADGTGRRLVVDGAPGLAWIPAWSPDGQWIAYTVSPNVRAAAATAPEPKPIPAGVGPPASIAGASIWLVRPDGSDRHQLSPSGTDAVTGVWSPDGTRMAYGITGPSGTGDIYIAPFADGALGNPQVVAPDPANEWGPAWSPDGRSIVFTSNRTGDEEVWRVSADGTNADLRQLTDSPGGDWVPAYDPDGSRIAFVSDRFGDAEICSMALDGSDVRNVSNHPFAYDGQWSVAWSPDGSQLAYAESSIQAAASSGWVREDLAVAKNVVFAFILAILALLLVALRAPFGAFTLVLLVLVGLSAASSDQWRFLPAAVFGGILVDLLVAGVRPTRRSRVAAAALPAVVVNGLALTIWAGGTLEWSITLVLGTTLVAGLIGWGLAELVERLLSQAVDTAEAVVSAR